MAIFQVLLYSAGIFGFALLLRPSYEKPQVWYMSQEKAIKKERNYG